MTDVVVTLPKRFSLKKWLAEGDAAGEKPSEHLEGGGYYHWMLPRAPKKLEPGDRVYVVYDGALIGYSPFVFFRYFWDGRVLMCRKGDAVAVTIDEYIKGFQGFRYRWWDREQERPWPTWKEDLLGVGS